MRIRTVLISFLLAFTLVCSLPLAGEIIVESRISVRGDAAEKIEEIVAVLPVDGTAKIELVPEAGFPYEVIFGGDVGGNDSVFSLTDTQRLEIIGMPQSGSFGINAIGGVILESAIDRRLIDLEDNAVLVLSNVTIQDFSVAGDGGAIRATDGAVVEAFRVAFEGNTSTGFGGALFGVGSPQFHLSENRFEGNESVFGGALSAVGNATFHVKLSVFVDNLAEGFGCDGYYEGAGIGPGGAGLFIEGSQSSGPCAEARWETTFGSILSLSATHFAEEDNKSIRSNATFGTLGSVFDESPGNRRLHDRAGKPPQSQDLCEEVGSGTIISLGYNVSADATCNLVDATDLPNTDPMIAMDADGIFVPQPGSPLIDSGPDHTILLSNETLESLSCGHKDLKGLGRPQDANDDGVFECDRGAVEVAGPGQIGEGHSAAFFNAARDGEGQYVEIINESTAVVYTFTHRPDGSGPAWFIGIGTIVGNSIVIDELLRPIGTSFGDAFDADEITNDFAGGQSMVFNDCLASAPGGNVAFTGNRVLGLEALITPCAAT